VNENSEQVAIKKVY